MRKDIASILSALCKRKGVEIIEAEMCIDRVHMLVRIPPSMSVSSFMGYLKGSGYYSDYNIEGIGNDFILDTMDMNLVDEIIKVSDEKAFTIARDLTKKEGIIAGSSSGAVTAAALKLIQTIEKGNVVVVLPDCGDRYFSAK